ncbi:hypothetical protein [Ruegeria jejuensis]|uniref:hypothetical protein n=1 Tax=Ruegeria jejuensis TaxID=3233338 RepID=UPI00355B3A1E
MAAFRRRNQCDDSKVWFTSLYYSGHFCAGGVRRYQNLHGCSGLAIAMMRTPFHAAILLLLSFSASRAWPESTSEDVWSECRADDSCVIEYDHLANQSTDPYMFSGKVVDKSSNKWRSHRRSIKKFSDVRECLVKSEQHKENPNLLKIDWDQVGFDHAAEVCIFRIARSLGDTQLFKDWFGYHGFNVVGPHRSRSESYKPRYRTQPMQTLSAKWSGAEYETQYEVRKGSLFKWFAQVYGIGGFAFNVRLSEGGQVVSVEANWTGKHSGI